MIQHDRFADPTHHLHGPFGADAFGRRAEAFARWFGTPSFLLGQTVMVAVWIGLNVAVVALRWDPYPFILLNLAFSLQAAYAAPLILLAQTRQADRDKRTSLQDAGHRDDLAARDRAHQELERVHHAEVRDLLEALADRLDRVEATSARIDQQTRP